MPSPQILTVDLGERSYDIQVGHGLLDENPAFQALARGRSVAVISDSNVDPIYGARVEALLAPVAHQVVRIVVPAGEASKCWQQLDAIHDRMLEAHLDRKSLVVALGGVRSARTSAPGGARPCSRPRTVAAGDRVVDACDHGGT